MGPSPQPESCSKGSPRSRIAAVELALSGPDLFGEGAPKMLQWLGRVGGFTHGPGDHRSVELALLALRRQTPGDAVLGLRPGQADSAYDGAWVGRKGRCYRGTSQLYAVPSTKPTLSRADCAEGSSDDPPLRLIYVNGVRSRVDKHAVSLGALANTLGIECVGLHVSSEGPNLDLLTAMAQRLRLHDSAAVATLESAILSELRESERPIRVVAHSLGVLIVARALERVVAALGSEPGSEERLARVEVTTLGGAQDSFPDGPKYLHLVNEHDPVAMNLGVGGNPDRAGRGAEIVRFEHEGDGVLLSRHGLMECYLLRLASMTPRTQASHMPSNELPE